LRSHSLNWGVEITPTWSFDFWYRLQISSTIIVIVATSESLCKQSMKTYMVICKFKLNMNSK
jgi:hypothetical protein